MASRPAKGETRPWRLGGVLMAQLGVLQRCQGRGSPLAGLWGRAGRSWVACRAAKGEPRPWRVAAKTRLSCFIRDFFRLTAGVGGAGAPEGGLIRRSFKIPGEEYAPPAGETVTIKQLEDGSGPEAASGSTVTMRYSGEGEEERAANQIT